MKSTAVKVVTAKEAEKAAAAWLDANRKLAELKQKQDDALETVRKYLAKNPLVQQIGHTTVYTRKSAPTLAGDKTSLDKLPGKLPAAYVSKKAIPTAILADLESSTKLQKILADLQIDIVQREAFYLKPF